MDGKQSTPENLILVNREPDGIAFVRINRPKSLNWLTKAMIIDLARAIKSLNQDDSVRVIILSGTGRAFCSGVDLTVAEDVFKGDVKDIETAGPQIELYKKPIIAAIHGFAVAGGFEIAIACPNPNFVDTFEDNRGNKAREVSLTATPLTVEVGERLGLVNHVVEESELLKKGREIAEAIVKNNQDLEVRYKAVINDGLKLDLGTSCSYTRKGLQFRLNFVVFDVALERAREYYNGMTKDQFKKMQEFIAGRSSKKPSSKL
ncbi:putative short-chain-enoyl-CoA hydratase [Rosa chinensis]|uniref:Putative short-chain-enoyl-CoA hydratase n=1 Tax=Rosa chinensis TaxID=74649 RepID=A0A2P6QZ94_ROSCH|nr:putative short-chain-enoyl-CoA hydratase [Rosa chinensis]